MDREATFLNKVLILVLLLCHAFCLAQQSGSVRLSDSFIPTNIRVLEINDGGLTYIENQTMHTLNPSRVDYFQVGDSIFGYAANNDLHLLRLNRRSADDAFKNYSLLMKQRRISEKLLISTGQLVLIGVSVLPGAAIGAVGGLITTAAINSTSGTQIAWENGAGFGSLIGCAAGAAATISFVGSKAYGHGNFKGSAAGTLLGSAACLWLIYQATMAPEGMGAMYVLPGLFAPVIGGMLGYYTELNFKRSSKTKTQLGFTGQRLHLGITF